jgi:hypothetical protein
MSSAVQHTEAGGSRVNCTEKGKEEWVQWWHGPDCGHFGGLILRVSCRGHPGQRVQLAGDASVGVGSPPFNSSGVRTCSRIPPAQPSLRSRSTRRIACSNHHATQTGGLSRSSATNHQRNPARTSFLPPSARTQGCPSPFTQVQ